MMNIPPILENKMFISSFKEKADLFNKYFSEQCNPLNNRSMLPFFYQKSRTKLSHVDIRTEQIIDIINKLNVNKAHSFDQISAHMLKLSMDEVCHPLKLIFEKCILECSFPSCWKKG